MNDLIFQSASSMAQKIQNRTISSLHVVQSCFSQIKKHNPSLNAIVTLNEESAINRAKEADKALEQGEVWGPLHGVPITIKDAYETKDLRTTSSFKMLSEHVPTRNASVVDKIIEAGGIIIGKTNLPQLAMDIQCNSPIFGKTNNPWNLKHTSGGSTGGGAVAVATGMSPLEIGSDAGGSIRIPAHFCGVFSIKPTEHRVSVAGHIPEMPGGPKGFRHMGCAGIISRSIEDLEMALDVISGPDGRQWEVPPTPIEKDNNKTLKQLRIAWVDSLGGVAVSQDTSDIISRVAGNLSKAGCDINKAYPQSFDIEKAKEIWSIILGSEIGAEMPFVPRVLVRLRNRMFALHDPMVKPFVQGLKLNMRRYIKALTERDAVIGQVEDFLGDYDAWLCPVSMGPAFTHCKTGSSLCIDGKNIPYFTGSMSYTTIFNMTGNPVVVIPVGFSGEGLPIGIQIVGRRWKDKALLRVAGKIAEVVSDYKIPPGF